MTKQEKNALGKVNSVLQIVSFILQSVLVTLSTYAPYQYQLIEIIDYIAKVISALLTSKTLPGIPNSMIPNDEGIESTRHYVISDENAPLIFEPREYGVVSESFAHGDTPLLEIGNAFLDRFNETELYPTKPVSKQEEVKNDSERFKGADPDCPRTF